MGTIYGYAWKSINSSYISQSNVSSNKDDLFKEAGYQEGEFDKVRARGFEPAKVMWDDGKWVEVKDKK